MECWAAKYGSGSCQEGGIQVSQAVETCKHPLTTKYISIALIKLMENIVICLM
jgi:hypothetical protein